MEEPHIEGSATHDDPAPCIDAREGGGEASAGARRGSVLSREIRYSRAPTPLSEAEGDTFPVRQGERWGGPARSETRGTCGTFLRENREIPVLPTVDGAVGRAGKAEGREPVMDGAGKSDRLGVYRRSRRTKRGDPRRRRRRERAWPRGTRAGKTRAGHRAGKACSMRSTAYGKQRSGTRDSDSPPCFTTSMWSGYTPRSAP
jgi:RNA-directed DNA polymerase